MIIYTVEEEIDLGTHVKAVFTNKAVAEKYAAKEQEALDMINPRRRQTFFVFEYPVDVA